MDVYQEVGVSVSCAVNRFIRGSVIVDYVLAFASSDTPNATLLDNTLRDYLKNCSERHDCFGTNSGASAFSGYNGMF